jgi:parallel beta-helix repeat protein
MKIIQTHKNAMMACMMLLMSVWIGILTAGDLNPPGPPTTGTMKPLNEVEPRTAVQSLSGDANNHHIISEPGSYYMTGNLVAEPNKCGIKIMANNVSLDLCGFTLSGTPQSKTGISIECGGLLPVEEVPFTCTIRNGTICTMGTNGLEALVYIPHFSPGPTANLLLGKILVHSNSECGLAVSGNDPNAVHVRLDQVYVSDNTSHGISLSDCYLHAEQFQVSGNGGKGLDANNSNLTLFGGDISYNMGRGIDLNEDAKVDSLNAFLEKIRITANGGHGMYIDAPTVQAYCHMKEVCFSRNSGDGLYINVSSGDIPIEEVSFASNGGRGLYVTTPQSSDIPMEQVSFTGNGSHGAELGMMTNVDAYGITSNGNGGSGIIINGHGYLSGFSAIGNNGAGIQVGSGSTIKNCTVRGNTGDGILVSGNCTLVGNTCEANTANDLGAYAGIHVTGSGNRIEANHVVGNNVGIDIDIAGNLVIRNSAFANITANYDIAPGNTTGPILTGTGDITSDNPHANYDF